jgi:hypothetical protein
MGHLLHALKQGITWRPGFREPTTLTPDQHNPSPSTTATPVLPNSGAVWYRLLSCQQEPFCDCIWWQLLWYCGKAGWNWPQGMQVVRQREAVAKTRYPSRLITLQHVHSAQAGSGGRLHSTEGWQAGSRALPTVMPLQDWSGQQSGDGDHCGATYLC